MIGEFLAGITRKNPVWVMPLALPITLFASQSWYMTLVFGAGVILVVTLTHGIASVLERWLPPDLAILAVLLVGGVVVTLAEFSLVFAGIILPVRALYLFRAMTVSGIMVRPALTAVRHERISHRLHRVLGLVVGFSAGLLVLTLVRVSLVHAGYHQAGSVAFGFFLLALGRIAANYFFLRETFLRENTGEERGVGGPGTKGRQT